MSKKTILALLVFMPVIAGGTTAAFAQTAITVEIGDNPACTKTSTSPHTTVDISGTCGNITISANVGTQGAARVDATEGLTDELSLKNAKIVASGGPVTNFHIKFSRDFASPPTTPPDVWYQITATGSIKRGALPALNDSIRLRGYMKDPPTTGSWVGIGPPYPDGTELSKTVTCANPGCENFSNLHTESPWSYLSSQDNPASLRALKGEFWFTLTTTGDTLRLNPVTVKKTDPPGGPPERE